LALNRKIQHILNNRKDNLKLSTEKALQGKRLRKFRLILVVASCLFLLAIILVGLMSWQLWGLINPAAPAFIKGDSMNYLRDVIGLNESEYKVVGSAFVPQQCLMGDNGLPLLLMSYDLKSPDDNAHVDFFYSQDNGTYTRGSSFTLDSDTLFYPPYPSDKVLNWTKGFLERYQRYQNNSAYVSDIRKTLDTIEHIQSLNTTCGNVALQIKIRQFTEEDIYTTIKFVPANQTGRYPEKALTFEYHNGVMLDFTDYF
jgi:hypothetical protein